MSAIAQARMGHATGQDGDIKEMLLRCEADRVRLQQQLAAAQQQRQHEATAKEQLQLDLDKALAGWEASRLACQKAQQEAAAAHADMLAAVREYRANEIIAVGLRDSIASLQQQLSESQAAHQAAVDKFELLNQSYAADVGDLSASLKRRIDELLGQLEEVTQQRDAGLADAAGLRVEVARVTGEAEARERRLEDEKVVLAKQVNDLMADHQKLVQQIEEIKEDRDEKAQQLTTLFARSRELDSELTGVREGLMVLSKTVQVQGCPNVPNVDDPVWTVMGPLGGSQYMLEVLQKHVRLQDSKASAAVGELERVKERLMLEGKRLTELQEQTFEVRSLYEKAVKDRVDLERRAHSAEAERLMMEQALAKARNQILEDEAKLKECHDNLEAMAQQVADLTPLTDRVAALLAENHTLMDKLERVQAQHDLLDRVLKGKGAAEERWSAMTEALQQEHQTLVEANKRLIEQLEATNKRIQELELQVREGSLTLEQLEATRARLALTESRLAAVTESHAQTLKKLETAKTFLAGLERRGSEAGAESPRRMGASADGQTSARLQLSPRKPSTMGAQSPLASPRQQPQRPQSSGGHAAVPPLVFPKTWSPGAAQQQPGSSPRVGRLQGSSSDAGALGAREGDCSSSGGGSGSGAGSRPGSRPSSARAGRVGSLIAESQLSRTASEQRFMDAFAAGPSEEAVRNFSSSLPPDVAALLAETGLASELAQKQKRWHDVKLAMLSYFSNQLRAKLAEARAAGAHLELQLLAQEAHHVEVLKSREQDVARKVLACVQEALAGLKQGLQTAQELRAATLWAEGELQQLAAAGTNGTLSARNTAGPDAAAVQGDFSDAVAGVLKLSCSSRTDARPGSAAELAWKISGSLQRTLNTERAQQAATAAAVAARREVGIQAASALQDSWLLFVRSLPRLPPPKQALNNKAVADAIVRVCLRAATELEVRECAGQQQGSCEQPPGSCEPPGGSGRATPAGGRTSALSIRAEEGSGAILTIVDALVAHYSAQSDTPGVYDESLMTDANGAVGRLLLSCRPLAQAGDVKAAMFYAFATSEEDEGPWGTGAWLFYLSLLLGLKQLLAGAWRSTTKEWATPAGAKLPMQCVTDLLGNCYNVQDPGQAGRCLPGLQELPVSAGQCIDMDQLLQLLMAEHRAGKLPRHALLHPRRLTDGVMGNMYNARGATPLSRTSTFAGTDSRCGSPGDVFAGTSRPVSGTSVSSSVAGMSKRPGLPGPGSLLPTLSRGSDASISGLRTAASADNTGGIATLPPVSRPESPSRLTVGSSSRIMLDKHAVSQIKREVSIASPLSSPSGASQQRKQQQQPLEGW